MKVMLEGMLPDDKEEEDTVDKRHMVVDSMGEDEGDFTEGEMTAAVNFPKNKKRRNAQ